MLRNVLSSFVSTDIFVVFSVELYSWIQAGTTSSSVTRNYWHFVEIDDKVKCDAVTDCSELKAVASIIVRLTS